jgi:hypothetical protein
VYPELCCTVIVTQRAIVIYSIYADMHVFTREIISREREEVLTLAGTLWIL